MTGFDNAFEDRACKKPGICSAIITSLAALIALIIAFLTPPISGPFAPSPIPYPYAEIASRFPRDYLWMYPAMILMLSYIVMSVCVFHAEPSRKKVWAHMGMIFAAISGATLFADYFIQVSVVQQSLLNGETDGIALLTQYNPHGLFIVLEEIGYMMMSLSFLLVAPVFSKKNKLDAAIRITLFGAFLLGLVSLVLLSILYGIRREYFFEVAIMTTNYPALIIFGILLGIRFGKIPWGHCEKQNDQYT